MERGGNGDADSLDFVEKVSVMLERLGSVSLSDFPGTRGVDVHHTHQFHAFYFSIFLRMELAKVTDTDDTDLEFFHLTGNPPLRLLNEMEVMLDLWGVRNFIFSHRLYRFLQCQTGTKNNAVGLLQRLHGLFRKVGPFKTNRVEPEELRPVSLSLGVGRDVQENTAETSKDGIGSNPTELVDSDDPPDDGPIFDHNVSCQGGCIRHE